MITFAIILGESPNQTLEASHIHRMNPKFTLLNLNHFESNCFHLTLPIFISYIGESKKTKTLLKARHPTQKSNFQHRAIPIEPYKLPSVPHHAYFTEQKDSQMNLIVSVSREEKCNFTLSIFQTSYWNFTRAKVKNQSISYTTYEPTTIASHSHPSVWISISNIQQTTKESILHFWAQGQVYNYINSLYPTDRAPSFLQLYFHDTHKEIDNRISFTLNISSS